MAGTLFIVATPLGNLEDITLRALRVLKEVSLIAAEDTRRSRKLLVHYGIPTPVTSYYDQIEKRKAPQLLSRLKSGADIALISDAGTPGIADPGYRLILAAIEAGVRVSPVPGPSMAVAALSASGLPANRFVFEGFVPPKAAARRAFYSRIGKETRTVVCFETGRRLPASLHAAAEVLGERKIVVAREVTKWFEEFLHGTPVELLERIGEIPVKGEVTLVLSASEGACGDISDEMVRGVIARVREPGMKPGEVARLVAMETGRPRREIYRMLVDGK